MNYYLKVHDKSENKFYQLKDGEAEILIKFLTSKNKSSHFEFRGEALLVSRVEIIKNEEDFYVKKEKEFHQKYSPR